jgi:hypothetical protein
MANPAIASSCAADGLCLAWYSRGGVLGGGGGVDGRCLLRSPHEGRSAVCLHIGGAAATRIRYKPRCGVDHPRQGRAQSPFFLDRALGSIGLLGPTAIGPALGLGLWGKRKIGPSLGLGLWGTNQANRTRHWTRALGSKANRTRP